eukprot:2386918-Pyramimonas_sp.AAC.1
MGVRGRRSRHNARSVAQRPRPHKRGNSASAAKALQPRSYRREAAGPASVIVNGGSPQTRRCLWGLPAPRPHPLAEVAGR